MPFAVFVKFDLPLVVPEELMNFKLSNIPGNSVILKSSPLTQGFETCLKMWTPRVNTLWTQSLNIL